MSLRIFLVTIFAFSSSYVTFAMSRPSIIVGKIKSINQNNIVGNEVLDYDLIQNKIKQEINSKGILLDEQSKVDIYQEELSISFTCFDCIILERKTNDEHTIAAWNGRVVN